MYEGVHMNGNEPTEETVTRALSEKVVKLNEGLLLDDSCAINQNVAYAAEITRAQYLVSNYEAKKCQSIQLGGRASPGSSSLYCSQICSAKRER